jgi:hypothetical protein
MCLVQDNDVVPHIHAESGDEAEEYYVVPEEALQFLPEEWRNHFRAMADDHRAVLKSGDNELSQIIRISKSFSALALKHVQKRLAEYKFAADIDAFMDLDILTTAFVVTYVRLHKGENGGSGFSRDALPEELRGSHDQIIELRNKRFAHNDDHHSVSNAMEIEVHNERFQIKFGLTLGYHIGGATEWHELVSFLDAMIAEKLYYLLAKLKEKTGRDWVLATGPAPD